MATETMLRSSAPRDPSGVIDVLAIVALAALPAAASLGGWAAFAIASVAGLAAFLVATQVAFQAGWVLAIVAPALALAVAALSALALRLWAQTGSRRTAPAAAGAA